MDVRCEGGGGDDVVVQVRTCGGSADLSDCPADPVSTERVLWGAARYPGKGETLPSSWIKLSSMQNNKLLLASPRRFPSCFECFECFG